MWICCLANRLVGTRYVVLVHDVYPDIAVELGALSSGGLITSLWRRFNKLAYQRTDQIVVLGRDMKKVIERELPPTMTNRCVTIIPNWADKSAASRCRAKATRSFDRWALNGNLSWSILEISAAFTKSKLYWTPPVVWMTDRFSSCSMAKVGSLNWSDRLWRNLRMGQFN